MDSAQESERMVTFTVYRGSDCGKIVKDTTTRPIKADDALVSITHSGLCGTDEHYLRTGCVLGHEGVGIVEAVGSGVHSVHVGDRVGFGYVQDVCGMCDVCLRGKDQLCRSAKLYGSSNLDQGSFATHVVWKASALYSIPPGLELASAAPLMCAGASVWHALTEYGLKAGDRVGVQGMGGLGHLAVQFASKLGCHVTVVSQSRRKEKDAMASGAHAYVATDEPGAWVLNERARFNHLLVCGSSNPDYTRLVDMLAPDGVIYPLTVSFDAVPVRMLDMMLRGARIQGTFVASRPSHRRMLEFAAQHGIKPQINEWTLNEIGIETAMRELRRGKMRYRGVLVNRER